MLQIGSVVDGKYKVLNKIGQGGMSVVYLALNERANKTWAIKEVRKDGTQDFATVKQGLIAETNILKSLNHKYLPSIVDVIDDGDTFLIVMDYIQGKSLNIILKESMEKEGLPIYVEDVISWGKQLCDVLYYLHTRPHPIIYRDMKPANVMLKPDGEISLIDFGTARIFKTGNSEDTTCLGTPGYAAPEQYGGNGQSRPQSDIYCLGATLHHLITGRNPAPTPFNFPKITQCRPTLLEETPRELRNVLLGLEMIIDKCTQYNPEDRYQSCAELKYDLEHPEELGLPYRRKLKKKMASFVGCMSASILLGAVSVFGMVMENRTEKSGYDYFLSSAETAISETDKIEYYRKAIILNPEKEEGYLGLMDTLLSDFVFSTDNSESSDVKIISNIMDTITKGRKKDNVEYLKARNPAGYLKLCYKLGNAYYYYSDKMKTKAASWYARINDDEMKNIDLGSDYDTSAIRARAQILQKISENWEQYGKVNIEGGTDLTKRELWNDLVDLFHSNVGSQDNLSTELLLCNRIANWVYVDANTLKQEGLMQEEIGQVLNEIESKIENYYKEKKISQKREVELYTDVKENIAAARTELKTQYSGIAQEKNVAEEGK